jgi:hypothetical protein
MAETERRKPPPKDLNASGKSWWRNIIGEYALDPAEIVLLHQLCRAVDILDRLNADLADMGVTVSGSTGQPKPNGLLIEIRETVKLVDQLQMALALPMAGETAGRRRKPQAKADARGGPVKKSRARIERFNATELLGHNARIAALQQRKGA